MNILDAIHCRRSIRKFKQIKIRRELLETLVEAARLAPSAANLQPLRYIIIDDEKTLNEIFSCLKWAGYIAPNGTPQENEKPVAYIVILVDKENIYKKEGVKFGITPGHDVGAAAENIMLAGLEFGLASCWLGSIDREKISQILKVPDEFHIDSVIALGYPAQTSIAEDMKDNVRYWLDENGVLHVPKRKLCDILSYNEFSANGFKKQEK